MRIRPDIERGRVESAQSEFEMAESKLDSALQYTRETDKTNHAAIFVDAQRSIERSTKAIFKLMTVYYPNKHVLSPESAHGRNLLNAVSSEVGDLNFSEQEDGFLTVQEVKSIHTNEVARIMFLCSMYGDMYPLAAYGIDKENMVLSSNDFIQGKESAVILESAVTGLRISDTVIDSIATGELPRSGRPRGPDEGPLECRSAITSGSYGIGKQSSDYDPVSDYRRSL